jgi:hypothetical protein
LLCGQLAPRWRWDENFKMPQIQPRVELAGVQSQRALEILHGRVSLIEAKQGRSTVVERIRAPRSQSQRPAELH